MPFLNKNYILKLLNSGIFGFSSKLEIQVCSRNLCRTTFETFLSRKMNFFKKLQFKIITQEDFWIFQHAGDPRLLQEPLQINFGGAVCKGATPSVEQ
jgi:hypothetical protein